MKTFFILFCFLITSHLRAQLEGQYRLDSLISEIPRQKEDTNKVMLLLQLAGECPTLSPDMGIKYSEQSLELATALNWKKGIAMSYGQLGLNYQNKSAFPKAMENNLKALKLYEELGNPEYITAATCNVGIVYMNQEDYPKALDYFNRALSLAEEIHHLDFAANILCNIGNIYASLKNFSGALEYYFKAINKYEEVGSSAGVALTLGNISAVYNEQKNYVMSIAYQNKALLMAEKIGDKSSIGAQLIGIGGTYLDMIEDTSQVKSKYEDNMASLDSTWSSITTIPEGKDALLASAIDHEQRGLALCKETENLSYIKDGYKNMSIAYQLMNDYKRALLYADSAQMIKDSIFTRENNRSIMEQGIKYEYEKKEAVAKAVSDEELKKQKLIRNGFIGGFAVVLFFALIFFGQRNKIKAGKKQSDELLLNILPAEVAEELKAKGSAEAKLIDEVTVLFTDFKGFTQLSEKLSPRELVAEINECFSAFDHIMQKHGVEKIKTIGDAYMAAGGLPTSNTTHANDVVEAALDIQQFMQEHKEKKAQEGKLYFEIRIGVHSGPVVAGIVGVKKFAYDIWGDTVNIASRMESSGEAGKVNISGNTYHLVKDHFHFIHRGKIQAKGKADMDMYFVEHKE